jgi:hypothetical protein
MPLHRYLAAYALLRLITVASHRIGGSRQGGDGGCKRVHLSPQFRAERHGRTTNLANETPASFVVEGLYRRRKNIPTILKCQQVCREINLAKYLETGWATGQRRSWSAARLHDLTTPE